MKMCRAYLLLVAALIVSTASRGLAEDKDDVRRILNEVGELRRAAENDRQDALKTIQETKDLVDSFKALAAELTKEAQARAEETKTLQKALEESRLTLFKLQEQTNDLKMKLAAAESQLQGVRKNNPLVEKPAAAAEKREPRKLGFAEEARLPNVPENVKDKLEPKEIRGKIAGIADAGLYVVSVGSDEGLKPALALDVFKVDDKTKRIGVITVVRCYSKQAVGQFKADGNERAGLGDEVTARVAK